MDESSSLDLRLKSRLKRTFHSESTSELATPGSPTASVRRVLGGCGHLAVSRRLSRSHDLYEAYCVFGAATLCSTP